MYILYVDESGTAGDSAQKHFVLAGIAVFDRQTWWLSTALDKIVGRVFPQDPDSVELHGNHVFGGKGVWRSLEKQTRISLIKEAFALIKPSMPLFGIAVERARLTGRDPVRYAFEQLCSRFDMYLQRHFLRKGDRQRGLIVFDKTSYETLLQGLAADFRKVGHTWGKIRNFSEVPLFLDSRASRLVQLADLIAYAIFRHVERGDSELFSLIEKRFDAEGGVRHGLYIKSGNAAS